MNDENYYVNKIINIFLKNFNNSYAATQRKGKAKILRYIEPIYRRWYYTTFIEETILSPANLIHKAFGGGKPKIPTIKPVNDKSSGGFECIINEYSLDNHPVVRDLEVFLKTSYPDISLDANGCFSKSAEDKIIAKLSICDPFYLDFLLSVSSELGLVKKVPSIHSSVFHISEGYTSFFKIPARKQFEDVVHAAVNLCHERLSEFLPTNKKVISNAFVIRYLTRPTAIDEIFSEIYSGIGINVDDIWDMETDDLDEIDNIILSSTFILGIMFDRWFLTPFGHYLKLIQPLYILPYKFSDEFLYLCDEMLHKDGDLVSTLYSPCSHYALTDIGSEYFDIPLTAENGHIITDNMPIKRIIDTVIDYAENGGSPVDVLANEQSVDIYEIRIRVIDDKRFWKVLEIQGTKTLHDLHMEICKYFNLSFANNYSMFLDPGLNPFSEYVSPAKNKKSPKKTHKIIINDLDLEPKQKLVYVIDNTHLDFEVLRNFFDDIKLELEIMSVKNGATGVIYPRIIKVSKLFKDIEEEMIY